MGHQPSDYQIRSSLEDCNFTVSGVFLWRGYLVKLVRMLCLDQKATGSRLRTVWCHI